MHFYIISLSHLHAFQTQSWDRPCPIFPSSSFPALYQAQGALLLPQSSSHNISSHRFFGQEQAQAAIVCVSSQILSIWSLFLVPALAGYRDAFELMCVT